MIRNERALRDNFINLAFVFVTFILATMNVEAEEQYRIGLATWSGYPESVQGFKDGLAEAGLIENKNVSFLTGELGADKELQQKVAQGFSDAGVDMVYSLTTPGTTIVKNIMPETTPIVFSIVTYPADSGLIESFEYSGNNLVGTSNYVPIRHYLSMLKLVVPNVKSVGIFHRKGEPNSKIQAANMMRLLKRDGIKGVDLEPENLDEVRSMAMNVIDSVDVFMTTTDTLMQSGGEKILVDISLNKRIPILSSNKTGIQTGATFGPVADFYTLGKLSGEKAAKILLQRINPERIESELQDPPLLLVNKASLEALGITLSDRARKAVAWSE